MYVKFIRKMSNFFIFCYKKLLNFSIYCIIQVYYISDEYVIAIAVIT